MSKINDNLKYKERAYWDRRFVEEKEFEWCKSFAYFEHLILKTVNKNDRILILGCGNSQLSNDMYHAGYENITNVDFSSVVLHNTASLSETPSMQWLVMDIQRFMFLPGSFDVVIEKATLDSLLVGESDPWNMSQTGKTLLNKILNQISFLLIEGGRFISLTFAQPHFRKKLLCQKMYNWSVEYFTYGDGFHFFYYVMFKGGLNTFGGQTLLPVEEEESNDKSSLTIADRQVDINDSLSGVDDPDFLSKINFFAE